MPSAMSGDYLLEVLDSSTGNDQWSSDSDWQRSLSLATSQIKAHYDQASGGESRHSGLHEPSPTWP